MKNESNSQHQKPTTGGMPVKVHDFLTEKQRRAITCLLEARTVSEAADLAEVSRRQLNRWRNDPLFLEEYHRQSDHLHSFALASLKGRTAEAVETLAGCLRSKDEKVRLTAASRIIEHSLKTKTLEMNQEQASETGFAVNRSELFDVYQDRLQAMSELADLYFSKTMHVVSELDPIDWQRIVFFVLPNSEWRTLTEKIGAPDVYGIQNAALFFLGALFGISYPDILKMWKRFLDLLVPGCNSLERHEVRVALTNTLRKLDLPPAEETEEIMDLVRERVRVLLDQALDTDPFLEDDKDDSGSDPEPPSSPEPGTEEVHTGIGQDKPEKVGGQSQDVNNSSGAGAGAAQAAPERPRLRRRYFKRLSSEGTSPQE